MVSFRNLLGLLASIYAVDATALTGEKSQSYGALSCCSILDEKSNMSRAANVDKMINCVNSSSSFTQEIGDNSIVYAMFASPEVYSYAAHATLVNGAFFEYHGYASRLLSAETGDDFYPKDRRWNKVKAVVRALQGDIEGSNGDGWASNTKAIVSIDTDLFILDWGLDVEQILDTYPEADLILSADALDIGNTGFLIVRNTPWAISFFQEWWDSRFMKHTFCDQHVLNKLYAALRRKEEEHKLAILENSAVNSRWPAIETMDSEDRVLHLMGETTPYRAAVARHASETTCKAYSVSKEHAASEAIDLHRFYDLYVPRQLDFSRDRLVQLAKGALAEERMEQYRRAASPLAKEVDVQRLHAANTNACDDKRPYLSNNQSECEGFFREEYRLIRAALRKQGSAVGQHDAESEDDSDNDEAHGGTANDDAFSEDGLIRGAVEASERHAMNHSSDFRMFLLDHLAKTLYNVVFFSPRDRKRESADRVLRVLKSMESEVDTQNPVNRIYLLHKGALIHSQLASYYFSIEEWELSLEDNKVAINAITDVLAICEEKSPDFAGYVLEYIDSASLTSETFFRLKEHKEALEWAQAALNNAQTLFSTFRGEERVIARDLARLHLLVAEMLIHNPQVHGHLELAEKQLKLARMNKLTFDVEHALPTAMKEKLMDLTVAIANMKKTAHEL